MLQRQGGWCMLQALGILHTASTSSLVRVVWCFLCSASCALVVALHDLFAMCTSCALLVALLVALPVALLVALLLRVLPASLCTPSLLDARQGRAH